MYSVAVVLEALRCRQGGKEQIAARSKVERGKEEYQRSRKVLDFQSALSVCECWLQREHVSMYRTAMRQARKDTRG